MNSYSQRLKLENCYPYYCVNRANARRINRIESINAYERRDTDETQTVQRTQMGVGATHTVVTLTQYL
jgi:hypothetical protein